MLDRRLRLLLAGLGAATLVAVLLLARETGWIDRLTDQERLRETVKASGSSGR